MYQLKLHERRPEADFQESRICHCKSCAWGRPVYWFLAERYKLRRSSASYIMHPVHGANALSASPDYQAMLKMAKCSMPFIIGAACSPFV
ncbi:MAG: hypothetical protein ACTTKK_04385 [Ottowia sp.]